MSKVCDDDSYYCFGYANKSVKKAFKSFMRDFTTLTEAVDSLLTRSESLCRKYKFLKDDTKYKLKARSSSLDDSEELHEALLRWQRYVDSTNYISMGCAIEEILMTSQQFYWLKESYYLPSKSKLYSQYDDAVIDKSQKVDHADDKYACKKDRMTASKTFQNCTHNSKINVLNKYAPQVCTLPITNHFMKQKTNELVVNKTVGNSPVPSIKSNINCLDKNSNCSAIVANEEASNATVTNAVNVCSTLKSDTPKVKSDKDVSTLITLDKSVLEHVKVSAKEVLTESEFNNFNKELSKFLLDNNKMTDDQELYPTNPSGKTCYEDYGNYLKKLSSKSNSQKVQVSECVEELNSKFDKQDTAVLNSNTVDKDPLTTVPSSNFRSKSIADKFQEKASDENVASEVFVQNSEVLHSNVESTLSSDDLKAKSANDSSTLIELYKSVLEYWVICSSDEVLTEYELNEKLNEFFLKNEIPTDNEEFKNFLLENDIPTDVNEYKKFLLESVIPADDQELFNSPGKSSKLISEKVQDSVCDESMISNNFKQENSILNSHTYDNGFFPGEAASLPISSFRSKLNVNEIQEKACDEDIVSKIFIPNSEVLNSNSIVQSFKEKPSTAEKELKISNISKPEAKGAHENLYGKRSFLKLDKPRSVVEYSNSCEENILSVKSLPSTTEKCIDNEKMHFLECQNIKHDDKNDSYSTNENSKKEGNTQLNDTNLLKEEKLVVNKTNFVNSVGIPETYEETADSCSGTVHEISEDSGTTVILSESEICEITGEYQDYSSGTCDEISEDSGNTSTIRKFATAEKTGDPQNYSCGTIHEISEDSGSTAIFSEFHFSVTSRIR